MVWVWSMNCGRLGVVQLRDERSNVKKVSEKRYGGKGRKDGRGSKG